MKVVKTPEELRRHRKAMHGTVGFVPTMGALHDGHGSLVEQSLQANDATVVSIFVNPTQFNSPGDLASYPDRTADDLALLEQLGVQVVFMPDYNTLYPDDFRYEVNETEFSNELCGAHRPGHFKGVLTVVMKLLNLVAPTRAYFGEKDYQQYLLIRDMAVAFFMDVEIVAGQTVRETDGLAMSSRNLNLSKCARANAPQLHALIESELNDEDVQEKLKQAGFEVDYVVTRNQRRFAAASLGGVRLIDNVARGD